MKHTRAGSGELLVLVHGALADETMWHPHIVHLETDYEVIAISLRHFHGADEGGFGLNTHADDLGGFLAQLTDNKPAHIVGWSYGADVVLNMLIRYNITNSSVFLYEPGFPGCLSGTDMEKWVTDANSMFGPVFEYFSQGKLESAVEALIDGSGNKQGYFSSQHETQRNQQLAKAETLAYQLNQQEEPDINERSLFALKMPFTVSYGSKTRDMFRLVSSRTALVAKAANLIIIEGEGHMLPVENPEKFSSIIMKHLMGQ